MTTERLRHAGFTGAEAWIEEAPTDLGSAEAYAEFVSCVCLRHHLDRLLARRAVGLVLRLRSRRGNRPVLLRLARELGQPGVLDPVRLTEGHEDIREVWQPFAERFVRLAAGELTIHRSLPLV